MMAVKASADHVLEVQGWLAKRGLIVPGDLFASTGYVVPHIAGVWLYLTDSSLAYLDILCSNPDAPAKMRHQALDLVVNTAIAAARESGVRLVLAPILDADVEARALRNGFSILGQSMSLLGLTLKEGS